jgi:hypothetical protein
MRDGRFDFVRTMAPIETLHAGFPADGRQRAR